MEDEDIQDMAYRIAEMLNQNSIDARRAEPILWMLLSNGKASVSGKTTFHNCYYELGLGKISVIGQ